MSDKSFSLTKYKRQGLKERRETDKTDRKGAMISAKYVCIFMTRKLA